jgi:hypothetical protein
MRTATRCRFIYSSKDKKQVEDTGAVGPGRLKQARVEKPRATAFFRRQDSLPWGNSHWLKRAIQGWCRVRFSYFLASREWGWTLAERAWGSHRLNINCSTD